jgi:mannose-6-phosphate isomerase
LIDEEATRCFRVKRLDVVAALEKEEDSFYVGIVTRGNGTVSSAGLTRDIRTGDKFFVPFQTDQVRFESRERMEILLALPPR